MAQSFEEIKANNDARKAYAQQFEQKNIKKSPCGKYSIIAENGLFSVIDQDNNTLLSTSKGEFLASCGFTLHNHRDFEFLVDLFEGKNIPVLGKHNDLSYHIRIDIREMATSEEILKNYAALFNSLMSSYIEENYKNSLEVGAEVKLPNTAYSLKDLYIRNLKYNKMEEYLRLCGKPLSSTPLKPRKEQNIIDIEVHENCACMYAYYYCENCMDFAEMDNV